MKRFALPGMFFAALIAFSLGAPPAGAMGSSSSGGGSSSSSASEAWSQAKKAIAVKDYDAAVPLLKQAVMDDPKNADAYNYLGYSHARQGKNEEAIGYYKQALAIDPEHKGANEYLGELYLRMGNLAAAEERLGVLDKACFFGCTEYDVLKAAVKSYKKTGKFSSSKGL
jgi:tetratricopeptide (TPR) repeat protein